MVKTNVMRILENKGISYKVLEYDVADGAIDGVSVAKKLGQNVESVFKTLVTQSNNNEFLVFVIPVAEELDLKKAAKSANVKSVSMLPQKLLLLTTGYIHGGCSPIGMKKQFRTFIDETATLIEEIAVSAGKVGEQVILSPRQLAGAVEAVFSDLTRV